MGVLRGGAGGGDILIWFPIPAILAVDIPFPTPGMKVPILDNSSRNAEMKDSSIIDPSERPGEP